MIKPNGNTWHRPNNEYCFNTIEEQYRIFTNSENSVYAIWKNGKSFECDTIALELEGKQIFNTADVYAVYGMGLEWDPTELERVRELQKKKRS